jgi:signal transduction histidine kinase
MRGALRTLQRATYPAPVPSGSHLPLRTRALVRAAESSLMLTRRSHICFELLKNSLRAVVERYGVDNEDAFPPIKVVVVEGSEDITIKISDEGGGIPRSAIPLIWTYLYTTMSDEGLDATLESSDFKAPMAGFGYGLPLSRLVGLC